MNLKKYQLIKGKNEKGEELLLRILDIQDNKVLVIDCNKKTMPVWKEKSEISGYEIVEDCLVNGNNNLGSPDYSSLDDLSTDMRKIIFKRFNIVNAVLPFLSNDIMRSESIQRVAEENHVTKQTVRKYLCSYLSTMDIRSLADKERNNEKPLTKDQKNMRKSLNKWYYTTKKRSLKNVYTLMLKNFYCDEEGKLVDKYPTMRQFNYFFHKYNKKQAELISREGLSCYQRNFRPLTGDGVQSFAPNVGVGMLDATVCDIYLVNESGGIIGRPILTACVDAYSGLCCGYSLSWEGGTYSLRDLMLNVISDKVKHCAQFAIKINESDWPCSKLPLKLVTDMGSEYKSSNFEQITDLGVQLVNLQSYRPELKGSVEKFFDVVQGYYRNQLKGKGVIEPDFQERGVLDYRKEACLTLADFEKILIHCIIFYNCRRIREDFPYTEEMLEAEIRPYPNEIWRWGCDREGMNLASITKEQLVMTLLPRAEGRFSRHGLSVNGMHYHNELFKEEYLQGKECVVSYNPDDVTKVWLIENGRYIMFDLIEKRFKDKGLKDIQSMKQKQRELVKRELSHKTQAEVDLARHIQVIAQLADSKENPSIKHIRDNRSREQHKNHKDFVKEVMK